VKTCDSIRQQIGGAEFAEKLASLSYGLGCSKNNALASDGRPLSRSSDGFHCIAACEPHSLHCITPCCLQAVHLGIQLRSKVSTANVYFGRGGSSELRPESLPIVNALADVLAGHLGPNSGLILKLFVAGHCGRGAPDFIQLPTTEERAGSVCATIGELLLRKAARFEHLQTYIYGCKANVTRRDIEESGQELDFSRAELRLIAISRHTDSSTPSTDCVGVCPGECLLLEWGRRWWEPQKDGGAALPLPTYKPLNPARLGDEEEEDDESSNDEEESDEAEEGTAAAAGTAHVFRPGPRLP